METIAIYPRVRTCLNTSTSFGLYIGEFLEPNFPAHTAPLAWYNGYIMEFKTRLLQGHQINMFDNVDAWELHQYILGFGAATSEEIVGNEDIELEESSRDYQSQFDRDPDFWRGVVEHAGLIYVRQNKHNPNPNLELQGSRAFLKRFQRFVENYVPNANQTGAFNPGPGRHSLHKLWLLGEHAKVAIHLLYDDAHIQRQDWLQRLHKIFMWEPKKWSTHLMDLNRQYPTFPPRSWENRKKIDSWWDHF